DVVAFGTEHDDGGTDVAQIDPCTVGHGDAAGREIVADKQFIDDELDLLRVQVDVRAPPALEFEITVGLSINLGIDVVLLGPQRVGRVLVFEILHQPRAVEFAGAEVARQRRQPASAEQPAGVAHRILAVDTGPVSQRRAGNDHRAKQLGAQRSQDHDRPAGLAIADYAGLAVGLLVPPDHRLDEDGFGARDALDGLARHGFGQETDEIAGMTRLHRDTDLAVRLETADSRPMTRARIDHDERTALLVDLDALGRNDADQRIVDRLSELAPIDD